MKNSIALYVGVVSLLLGGCASVQNKPLSDSDSSRLNGKSIVSTVYSKPDFTAFTAAKQFFGVLGSPVTVSQTNAIVKNVNDPALKISSELKSRLIKSKDMRELKGNNGISKSDDLGYLLSKYAGADYILDVRTTLWLLDNYPDKPFHYRVRYVARFRLVEASSKSVVAESICATIQGDDKNPPTKEEILNNNAELLKQYFDKAADVCIDALSKHMLL